MTANSLVFGGDIGFKQFKGSVLTHDLEFDFTNVIGFPTEVEIDQMNQSDDMIKDLSVSYQGVVYYVGEKAVRDASNHRYTFLAEKVDTIDEKIKLLTALGILHDNFIPDIDLFVTGAPVEEYHLVKDKIKGDFAKEYEYIFRGESRRSQVRGIEVIPQGAGDYYDYILTNEGDIIEDKVLPKQVVVNMGFRTTEIVTMNYGKFSRSESTTLYTASNTFHKELRRLLVKEYGVHKNLAQVDEIFKSGAADIDGMIIDITPLRSKAVAAHIGSITGEIPIYVNPRDIHEVILGGGMAPVILPFMQKSFRCPIRMSKHPVMGNARGGAKYGRMLLNG